LWFSWNNHLKFPAGAEAACKTQNQPAGNGGKLPSGGIIPVSIAKNQRNSKKKLQKVLDFYLAQ
jgi:hypothetical protein